MLIRRILVPVDGSELSLRAAALAAQLAERFDAGVTLLTALHPPEVVRAYVSESVLDEVRRAIQQAGEKMLDEAAARVMPHRPEIEKRSVFGEPAAAIAAE